MNCTRVLHILNPRPLPNPIMPVDVAMRLCLSHSPPLRSFLSSYEDCRGRNLVNRLKPMRPCINLKNESEAKNPEWRSPKTKSKKQVVFADSKGLSLTAIHIFSEFEENPMSDLQFDLADLEDATSGLKLNEEKNLVLDFSQPAADYLEFRNRLKKNFVSLENCSLQERSLAGTVKVRNVSFEKSVHIRITFDTWKNCTDVECTFMNNVYGCSETDTFSFVVDLPNVVAPHERIEFCVCFKSKDQTYWDNNDGQNYRLVHTEWKSDGIQAPPSTQNESPSYKNHSKIQQVEIDQFGSPRTSNGLFPEWQSWGRFENTAPYW
ncbi:protein phosphatase 1 regulatory subunit 3C-B-like [Acipenser oxyrinchus oxyrinchus]|uniref:Protein phosphatase 1 regulatory subunit 3C n=1 Tax=Acipenser oxyrinchus oxyrinchus TaxID=40147 RepID=A0AAD8D9F9_ACIOX|nr:protein phosphatase 1 regulatory subunit 3C-B-like [Acipenser oxyrinchus oxyrinchus]